jgi:hypothetical protein
MDHITKIKYDYYTKEIDLLKKTLEPGLRKIQKLSRSKYMENTIKSILTIFFRFLQLRDNLVKN